MQYLGYRHVTGIKSWSVASKAKYLYSLLPTLKSEGIKSQSIFEISSIPINSLIFECCKEAVI
jgi:hypothetical protein